MFYTFVLLKGAFKYIFTITTLIYLMAYAGIPVYYHYCGGELESIQALVKADNCCGEEEEEDSDCCQNEVKVLDQKSETLLSQIVVNFEAPLIVLTQFSDDLKKISNMNLESSSIPFYRAKVPLPGREILSFKQVLII